MGYKRMPVVPFDSTHNTADRMSQVVIQQKKGPLFSKKKMKRVGQLWVVGVWDLRARGNTDKISPTWEFVQK
jgi:hypothetical protein